MVSLSNPHRHGELVEPKKTTKYKIKQYEKKYI
jgi:hypothetical protein